MQPLKFIMPPSAMSGCDIFLVFVVGVVECGFNSSISNPNMYIMYYFFSSLLSFVLCLFLLMRATVVLNFKIN